MRAEKKNVMPSSQSARNSGRAWNTWMCEPSASPKPVSSVKMLAPSGSVP